MSYAWSRNDKKNWESNEVLMEFEKRLLRAAKELEGKIDAHLEKDAQALDQKINDRKEQLGDLQETADNVTETLENMSEDEEVDRDPTPEEEAAARKELVEELRAMVAEAVSKRDIKLAYKIERTIEELTLED
jgi:hypothetical protein